MDVYAEICGHFAHRPAHRFAGCRVRADGLGFRFANLLEDGEGAIALAPPVHTLIDLGDGEFAETLQRGLWLDEEEGVRYGVLMELNSDPWRHELRVEIAVLPSAPASRYAKALLDRLITAGNSARTHRGQTLVPYQPPGHASIDFQRLPLAPASRDEIILDARAFDLFTRSTLGFIKQAEAMAKLGFPSRKGVLLYGPPGTGKTLLIRYLATQLHHYTRFILTPDTFPALSTIMQAARKMLPALVVIEDVDLIAEDRSASAPGDSALLNCLLNEMEGLAADARILFILTTNRPEVLEPALASRPGRIDQAIEVGLPAEPERRLLLRRFARSVHVAEEVLARASERTGGASPAFLKELVRRAVQGMLEAGGKALEWGHLQGALEDMVEGGGSVGAKLVGGKAIGFT